MTRAICPAESLECRTYLSVSQDSNGFTVITPDANSHVIYVSTTGNDGNDGKTSDHPVKTIAKGKSLVRDGSSDQLLLKRGDVWHESIGNWDKSGKSSDQPIVIGAYGSGARPELDTGSSNAFYSGGGSVDHLSIVGVAFVANTRIPGNAGFATSVGEPGLRILGAVDDLLIEDCLVRGYHDNILLQNFFGPITNVRIRRSEILDSYSIDTTHAQGLYAEGINGLLLDGNVFDHNGWMEGVSGASATSFNHNVYMRSDDTGVVVKGNIFARASSHGLQARGGGDIEDNLFVDDPIGMSFGLVNGSPATPGGVSGTIANNVFIGGGHDSIGQGQRGWALEIGNTKKGGGTTVSGNVFAGDGTGAFPAILLAVGGNVDNFNQTAGLNDLTIENNVIHNWYQGIRISPEFQPGDPGPAGLNDVVIKNNDFQDLAQRTVLQDSPFSKSDEIWSGNRYDAWESTVHYQLVSWDNWKKNYEPTATKSTVKYPSPGNTAATYSKAIGGGASSGALEDKARTLSSQSWQPAFTGSAANAYIRAGFFGGTGAATPPKVISPTPTPTHSPNPTSPSPTPSPSDPTTPPTEVPVTSDPPPDQSVAPVAQADVPAQLLVTAGDAALTFSVTYVNPDSAIDVNTLDAGDVRVTGRNGFDQPATLVGVTEDGQGAAMATYAVTPADGGPWEAADRGTYTIVSNADQVRDVQGTAVQPAKLAQFKVKVGKAPKTPKADKPAPPDKAPFVRKLKFSARGNASVTATFSEDVSATLDASDLLIMNEDGSRAVDPSQITLAYNAKKNVATWTFAGLPDGKLPKGKYRVGLTSGGIADSAGQALDGNRDGVGGDDYSLKKLFNV